ncbi:MAG: DUF885 domain-containing protein [Eubacteriales bacterium]|nr:DUF885 domain-containing protein [Eubacteriales bacterium]
MFLPFSRLSRTKKAVLITCGLFFVLLLGLSIGYLSEHVFSENGKFQSFTRELFRSEAKGNTLTLHYTLAEPKKLGISPEKATLGRLETDPGKTAAQYEAYEKQLKSFDATRLSRENQVILDTLLLYFHNQNSVRELFFLGEPLGPSLGIQAQLPILLAEYAFYDEGDISEYLQLLTDIRPYFQSILDYEREKAQKGWFMNDQALEGILSQCGAFIQKPEENYMLEIFEQKLKDFPGLSAKDKAALNAAHRKLLFHEVIPAYQILMEGLSALRGSGNNPGGLAGFSGGQEYYAYLIRDQGLCDAVPVLRERLAKQLMEDSRAISAMQKEQPSLFAKLSDGTRKLTVDKPEDIMEQLQKSMKQDFPALPHVPYEIRCVHPSLEDFLSPAFYLTPPMDRGDPNVIYLNPAGTPAGLELFTTLGHEGFPGHLYQTVFFCRQKADPIRSLFSASGYVEGWATYAESFVYDYAASFLPDESARDLARLAWLNRSVNLCLYSLMDIGIHYQGWSQSQAAVFLNTFGIRDAAAAGEIYQYIVEAPANYLKYYCGYLSFLDLRRSQEAAQGEHFDQKAFHESILKLGPVPFPVLKKYLPVF